MPQSFLLTYAANAKALAGVSVFNVGENQYLA